jgi:hypothetical protein
VLFLVGVRQPDVSLLSAEMDDQLHNYVRSLLIFTPNYVIIRRKRIGTYAADAAKESVSHHFFD